MLITQCCLWSAVCITLRKVFPKNIGILPYLKPLKMGVVNVVKEFARHQQYCTGQKIKLDVKPRSSNFCT